MEIDKKLLLESFRTETGEGLAQMEEALLELESRPEDVELVNTAFRVVHTFKGNAAMFELKHALEFAHVLEDLLDGIRTCRVSLSPEIGDVLLASIGALREFADAAIAGSHSPTLISTRLLPRIKGALEAASPAGQAKISLLETTPAEMVSSSDETVGPSVHSARTLRVDIQKLDRLLDLTGELAIARGRTTRLLEGGKRSAIEEIAEAHDTEVSLQAELQELVMKVRMVPVEPLFRQYMRIVRDLGKELGKTVRLKIEGGVKPVAQPQHTSPHHPAPTPAAWAAAAGAGASKSSSEADHGWARS